MLAMSISNKGVRYVREILEYSKDIINSERYSSVSAKDVLGFDIPKGATVFLPHIRCVPTTALLPFYDTLVVGIPHFKNLNDIRAITGLTLEEIIALSHKGKLILYFDVDCPLCLVDMSPLIEKLIDNNVKFFFSVLQSTVLCLKVASPIGVDIKAGEQLIESSQWDSEDRRTLTGYCNYLKKLGFTDFRQAYLVFPHQLLTSMVKPTAEYVKYLNDAEEKIPYELNVLLNNRLKITPDLLLSRAFSSNFSTNVNCRYFSGIDAKSKPTVPTTDAGIEQIDSFTLDFLERKLSIAYSNNMSLNDYSDLFDSKVTTSLRRLVKKIALDASSNLKPIIHLQNSINEYNRQVEELALRSTKRAKVVYATSDILKSNGQAIKLLMEGVSEKYLNTPEKAWSCAVLPNKYRNDISQWLKDKALNVESKLAGVSPEVIQLYRTQTCITKLNNKKESKETVKD